MQISHSRVECHKSCPYKYKLRYIDKLETVKDTKADNALYLGTALHTGLETRDIQRAIRGYYAQYPVIDNDHVVESMKLEHMLHKTIPVVPHGLHEVKISHPDFVGYIDLLVPTGTAGEYDLYDFKYSNHLDKYLQSPQLHLYKYFYELTTGHHIRDLYYICIPKVTLKRKWDEPEVDYRRRVTEAFKPLEPQVVKVDFKPSLVMSWMFDLKHTLEDTEYNKNENYLCSWCEYQQYCKTGDDTMILPSVERRQKTFNKKVMWIYGAPFSGKSTLADQAPNPLNLNTDGNMKHLTTPTISIKDEVTVTGRITNRKLAWDVLDEAVTELEKGDNEFKTIIVDLLDDLHKYCRAHIFAKLHIEHESEAQVNKAWDMVNFQFLQMVKRITMLPYDNIILISHVKTSRDIMKRNGDNVTQIAPPLSLEKVCNPIAGMVDVVARVVVDGDERTLNFKADDVIFGGDRVGMKRAVIPLKWDELMRAYDEACGEVINEQKIEKNEEKIEKNEEKIEKTDIIMDNNQLNFEETQPQAEPRQRRRRV